ncbi:MAG: tetratricopeptide repeat protein [Chitinophagaceae bacterium]
MKYILILWIVMMVVFISCDRSTSKTNLEKLVFLQDINDSIKQYPHNPGFYLGRATRLVKNDYKEEALADIEKSFMLFPSAQAAFQKFNILLAQNKLKEAILWLDNSIKILPSSLYLHLTLCNTYLQEKDTLAAQQILTSIKPLIEKSKDPFDVLQSGELLLCVKDTNAALKYARKSYNMQPFNNEAGFLIAYILSMKKQKEILFFSDTLLKNYEEKVFHKIYFFNGRYYENIDQYPKAIFYYNKAIYQLWSFIEAYMRKAYCQKKLNQYREALQTLSVASRVQTPNEELMFEIADCYDHLRDTTNALEYYQHALKNNKLNKDTIIERIQQLTLE